MCRLVLLYNEHYTAELALAMSWENIAILKSYWHRQHLPGIGFPEGRSRPQTYLR